MEGQFTYEDWDQALIGFTMIAEVEPGYRDVQERAENARKQQQIARWQAEAQRLYEAGQWTAVVSAGEQLHGLDPDAADPDGLVTSARAKLAATEQAEQLDADYETAQRLLDAGDWQEAIGALERVAQVNPAYRATPALLDQARRHLAGTEAPPPAKAKEKGKAAGKTGAEELFSCHAVKRWALWSHTKCTFSVSTRGIKFTDNSNPKYSFEVPIEGLKGATFGSPKGALAVREDLLVTLPDGTEYEIGLEKGSKDGALAAIKQALANSP